MTNIWVFCARCEIVRVQLRRLTASITFLSQEILMLLNVMPTSTVNYTSTSSERWCLPAESTTENVIRSLLPCHSPYTYTFTASPTRILQSRRHTGLYDVWRRYVTLSTLSSLSRYVHVRQPRMWLSKYVSVSRLCTRCQSRRKVRCVTVWE